jgi:hypothetical protein
MRCEDAQELITALVDDELTVTERSGVEAHLAECPDCRSQHEQESALKRDIKSAAAAVAAPPTLREQIERHWGKSGSEPSVAGLVSVREWLASARLWPVYAFAAVILVAAALLFQWQPNKDVAAAALAMHENIVGGKTALVRVTDAAQLRRELAGAVNGRFAPIALDLSMMKLYPVAGVAQKIGDRDILITVYEGEGATITCFTFLGGEADAPRGSERIFDPDKKINFYAFSRGRVNGVMHGEGQVICILVSKMAAAELLDVARGKPHHA